MKHFLRKAPVALLTIALAINFGAIAQADVLSTLLKCDTVSPSASIASTEYDEWMVGCNAGMNRPYTGLDSNDNTTFSSNDYADSGYAVCNVYDSAFTTPPEYTACKEGYSRGCTFRGSGTLAGGSGSGNAGKWGAKGPYGPPCSFKNDTDITLTNGNFINSTIAKSYYCAKGYFSYINNVALSFACGNSTYSADCTAGRQMAEAELTPTPTLTAVRPDATVAQPGVQLEFDGTDFLVGAIVDLQKADGTKIPGTSVGVFNNGGLIKATFDLSQATTKMTVIVTNPQNKSATLPNALTVINTVASPSPSGSVTPSPSPSGSVTPTTPPAGSPTPASPNDAVTLENPLGAGTTPTTLLAKIFSNGLTLLAVLMPIVIIIGAFQMMFSSGNPEEFAKGRQTIVYAAIGFAVVLCAQGIVAIIKSILTG